MLQRTPKSQSAALNGNATTSSNWVCVRVSWSPAPRMAFSRNASDSVKSHNGSTVQVFNFVWFCVFVVCFCVLSYEEVLNVTACALVCFRMMRS